MAEWLVEEGIGEHRAALVDGAEILAAKLDWPGRLALGLVEDAHLVSRPKDGARGIARFASGEEALVDRLPLDATEGTRVRLEVTRAGIAEAGRYKRANARPTRSALRPAPTLAEQLQARVVRAFPDCGWEDLWSEAREGQVLFSSGTLQFSPTPAMTVIDIDGTARTRDLALAAVGPLAQSLRRFDLGGNIGIDFPTLEAKADRRAVDAALAAELADWPHERTAMNGFGFVQLIARLEGPSLLHRLQHHPVAAGARRLLRLAERVEAPGALLLRCNQAVASALERPWIAELQRRTGRTVRIEPDPGLASEAAFAQATAL